MKEFVQEIKYLLNTAREKVYSTVSYTMIECYWEIGKRIVDKEQLGHNRAAYGKELIKNLSDELGKGFSTRTLRDIRKCYLTFPLWEDLAHVCAKLEWSHIRAITRVTDPLLNRICCPELGSKTIGTEHKHIILSPSYIISQS